jgi:UDP-N-acetylglucosamine diphosphorylase/glucosamine-1-phosphate N-acetyltransferase
MDNYILFDHNREHLLPFTYMRPVSEIRIGILTIREHYEVLLDSKVSYLTEDYLSEKYPQWKENENLFLNGAAVPSPAFIDAARNLKLGQALFKDGVPLASFSGKSTGLETAEKIEYNGEITLISHPWDIFLMNETVLKSQFRLLTHGKRSASVSDSNRVLGRSNIFIEEGAKIECSVINAETGPVYIGKGAEVMEGCMIRGPFALCEMATLKMGTKVYGATTIGPHSKVGGEITNSVIFGYSNKAHDGFLGNSVIGEWCNLGADTNNSNLKNNYSQVKVWNYPSGEFIDSGQTFCGLFMGDHSKAAINTMFNTGTVTGVNSNILGAGFPPKFIPSFSWGGFDGADRFDLKRALEIAASVYDRRSVEFDHVEKSIMEHVFRLTESTEKAR